MVYFPKQFDDSGFTPEVADRFETIARQVNVLHEIVLEIGENSFRASPLAVEIGRLLSEAKDLIESPSSQNRSTT